MKISLNIKFIDGPFGGAMQFARSLKDFLESKGAIVINNLSDENIDIILHIAPFPFQGIDSFSHIDAQRYKINHPDTIIIERINECDERKNTHYMNKFLIEASKYSDFVVFIASWLKPLLENQGLDKSKSSSIILNGADHNIFNRRGKEKWNKKRKLRLVTHHWGANSMKGHDIYQKLDDLLSKKEFSDRFEFMFIGNIPKEVTYKNTTVLAPLSGFELAEKLKFNDVYITASRNEPAGMHHIEGALCGLPILYIESGALPEYCHNFGVGFSENNLAESLNAIYDQYEALVKNIEHYPYTSDYMNEQYYKLFENLLSNKSDFQLNKKNTYLLQLSLIRDEIFLQLKSLLIRISSLTSK